MKKTLIVLAGVLMGLGLGAQSLTDTQAKTYLKVMEEFSLLDSSYFESAMEKGLESGGGLSEAMKLVNENIQNDPEKMKILKKNNLTWDQWKAKSRQVFGGVLYLAFMLPAIQQQWQELEKKALALPESERKNHEDYMIYRFFMDLEKEFRNTLILETLKPHLKAFAKAMDLSLPSEEAPGEEP